MAQKQDFLSTIGKSSEQFKKDFLSSVGDKPNRREFLKTVAEDPTSLLTTATPRTGLDVKGMAAQQPEVDEAVRRAGRREGFKGKGFLRSILGGTFLDPERPGIPRELLKFIDPSLREPAPEPGPMSPLEVLGAAGRTGELPTRAFRQSIAGEPESQEEGLFEAIKEDIKTDPLLLFGLLRGGTKLVEKGIPALFRRFTKEASEEAPLPRIPEKPTPPKFLKQEDLRRIGEVTRKETEEARKFPFAPTRATPQDPFPVLPERMKGLPKEFVEQADPALPPRGASEPLISGSLPGAKKTEFLGMIRSADKFLEANGAGSVVAPLREADRLGDKFQKRFLDKFLEIMGDIKPNSKEAKDIVRLLNNEVAPSGVAPIENRAIIAARRLRDEVFDPIIEMIQDPELVETVGEVGYIKGYFPYFKKTSPRTAPIPQELAPEALRPSILRERTGKQTAAVTDFDIFSVVPKYVRASSRSLFDLKAYGDSMRAVEAIPDNAANFKEFAKWYADNFVGHPRAKGDMSKRFWRKAQQFVSDRYYDAFIGLNPQTATLNLSQTMLNTFPELGTKSTGVGITKLMTKKGRKLLGKSGIFVDFPGLERAVADTKYHKAMFKLFQAAEYVNRGVAYLGGLHKASTKGLTGDAAERFALQVVEDTQFTYGRLSPIRARSRLGPSVTQFWTFTIKESEFLAGTLKAGLQGTRKFLQGTHTADDLADIGKMNRMFAAWTVMGAVFGDSVINILSDFVAPKVRDTIALTRYLFVDIPRGEVKPEQIPVDAINAILDRLPGQGTTRLITGERLGKELGETIGTR